MPVTLVLRANFWEVLLKGLRQSADPEILRDFSKFLGANNNLKIISLDALTTLELFASLVPRRMQILSSGDGLEGHFQLIF